MARRQSQSSQSSRQYPRARAQAKTRTMARAKANPNYEVHANRKQQQEEKLEKVAKLVGKEFELCRGSEACCGKKKPIWDFPPSSLKCICKECGKKIREKNRQDKIDTNEDHYIYEKIKHNTSRVSIFSSTLKCPEKFFYDWIKHHSEDPFNEHFDHVLPIHFFKKFSVASPYLSIRDSWINITPLDATENLKKGTDIDFKLFDSQLTKAKEFIDDYDFESEEERKDMNTNYWSIFHLFKSITQ